jgi:hypothetical protein
MVQGTAIRTATVEMTAVPSISSPMPTLSSTPIPPTSISIPDRPLDQVGPWLLFANNHDLEETWILGISNLDGTGFSHLSIPISNKNETGMDRFHYSTDLIDISPSGNHLSVLAVDRDLQVEIWIIRIPTLEIVRKIPLLSQNAYESIIEFQVDPSDILQTISPLLSIIQVDDLMEWSPDGSYLAFVGAIDGDNLDVYIFEENTDDIKRLTDGPTDAILMGWSPDSQWIVHMGVQGYVDGFADIDQVWGVSAKDGRVQRLYEGRGVAFDERITGWTSDRVFLAEEWVFESPLSYILQVNIEEGSSQKLFELPSMGFAYNPDLDVLLGEVSGFLGPGPDIEHGLYKHLLNDDDPRLILPGKNFYRLEYHPSLGLFSVGQSIRDGEDQFYLLNESGEVILSLPGTSKIIPSPDGTLLLASCWGDFEIIAGDGELLKEIGDGDPVWSPDSTRIYFTNSSGLFVYQADNEWEGMKLSDEYVGFSLLAVVGAYEGE